MLAEGAVFSKVVKLLIQDTRDILENHQIEKAANDLIRKDVPQILNSTLIERRYGPHGVCCIYMFLV